MLNVSKASLVLNAPPSISVSGNTIVVVLNSNANSPANNFGEVLPSTAQLSGFVYEDNDRSSTFNGGDTPIGGATVVLTGTLSTGGAITPITTTTSGGYSRAGEKSGKKTRIARRTADTARRQNENLV